MIEIIGEPRKATKEELKEFEEKRRKEVENLKTSWKEEMLRKFLKNH